MVERRRDPDAERDARQRTQQRHGQGAASHRAPEWHEARVEILEDRLFNRESRLIIKHSVLNVWSIRRSPARVWWASSAAKVTEGVGASQVGTPQEPLANEDVGRHTESTRRLLENSTGASR